MLVVHKVASCALHGHCGWGPALPRRALNSDPVDNTCVCAKIILTKSHSRSEDLDLLETFSGVAAVSKSFRSWASNGASGVFLSIAGLHIWLPR